MGEQCGLSIFRGGKLIGRPFEAEATDVRAKRGIDFAKHCARDRERFRQILSHPRLLRALTWEKEYDIHR
jgi:hypothetical protein